MQRSTLFSECLCFFSFFVYVKEAFVLSDKVWRGVCVSVCAHVGLNQYLRKHYSQMSWIFLIFVFLPTPTHPSNPLKHSLLGQNTPSQLKNRYATSEHMVGIDRLLFSFVKKGDVINCSEMVSTFPRWRLAYARVISVAPWRGGSGLWMRGKRQFMLMTACCWEA